MFDNRVDIHGYSHGFISVQTTTMSITPVVKQTAIPVLPQTFYIQCWPHLS